MIYRSVGSVGYLTKSVKGVWWLTDYVGRGPRASRAWLFLGLAIVTEVAGSLSLKAALDNPAFYLVVVGGYVAAFSCLAQVLREGLSLGVAYGVWGAAGVALTAIFSTVLFGEPMTWVMALGIAVIIAGVVCIEIGAQAANRSRSREAEQKEGAA